MSVSVTVIAPITVLAFSPLNYWLHIRKDFQPVKILLQHPKKISLAGLFRDLV